MMGDFTVEQILEAYKTSKSIKTVIDVNKHNMTENQINIFNLAYKELRRIERKK